MFKRAALIFLVVISPLKADWTYKPSDWVFKASGAKVTLVQKDGKRIVLDPLPVRPTSGRKWFTSITYNLAVQGVKADVSVNAPIKIELGSLNPKTLEHPFVVVKPKVEGTQRTWSMKMKNSGEFLPFEEHQVFKTPLTALRGDGAVYSITLPELMAPGEYLLFTDAECWEFTVAP